MVSMNLHLGSIRPFLCRGFAKDEFLRPLERARRGLDDEAWRWKSFATWVLIGLKAHSWTRVLTLPDLHGKTSTKLMVKRY